MRQNGSTTDQRYRRARSVMLALASTGAIALVFGNELKPRLSAGTPPRAGTPS